MRRCYRPCHTSCCYWFCCCLFLSMVVWQPFGSCWRLIIARVSEMHVAYHISHALEGYLFIGTNKQKAKKTKSRRPLLYILPASSWWAVRSRAVRSRETQVLDSLSFAVSFVSMSICLLCIVIVPQYGRLAANFELLAVNHSACLRNARRIS